MLPRLAVLAVVLAVLAAGCGTGISVDPASDPPHTETGDDGGKIQTIDAAEDGQSTDAEDDDDSADAPAGEDDVATEAATRADGSDAGDADTRGPLDGAPDARGFDAWIDASRDGADDLRSDISLDGVPDVTPDLSVDVFDEPTGDSPRDATEVGRDAAEAGHDATDASGDPKDGAQDSARDADARDTFDGCTVSCWPVADYYVDATAPPGGNGSKQQPFKTITAAIEAHGVAPRAARKAYVATGTYDEALGERFPLVLRGLSLEGAGQDRTFIMGAARINHNPEGGSIANYMTVAVVVGERDLPTQLSGLSVRSPSPVPVTNYYGVLCDRGNATGEVASPLGQTRLDQVTVGPGFATDVAVATSTNPSSTGCNMFMTRSTITAAWRGVIALGCGSANYDDPVMLEMGTDDPSSGNTISWMTASNDEGVGVVLQDCVIRGSFQYNAFRDGGAGISIADAGTVSPPHTRVDLSFKHNVFERLSNYGLRAAGYTLFASQIEGNRFNNVTKADNRFGYGAIALSIDVFNVGKIRGNEFIGNDTGVAATFSAYTGTPGDFGTAADPGKNIFRCNSVREGAGGDVMITGDLWDPEMTWAGTLSLVGNAWDHVPPSLLTTDPPPNGIDISVLYAPHTDVDRRNATLSTAVCPSGRVPGQ